MTISRSIELLIWIPTYNRFDKLVTLLRLFESIGVPSWARIIISDNNSSSPLDVQSIRREGVSIPIKIISSRVNYTAGVNFLKSFEYARPQEWIWIHGDDDIPSKDCFNILERDLECVSDNTVAVKYDSSLYGHQQNLCLSSISQYKLPRNDKAQFFGNLLLVSNWVYRPSLLAPYFPSAILSYCSHMSHVVLLLVALDSGRNLAVRFSSQIVTDHGKTPEAWNAAITYVHMLTWWRFFFVQVNRDTRSFILTLIAPSFKTAFRLFATISSSKLIRQNLFYSHISVSFASWRYFVIVMFYPFSYLIFRLYVVLFKDRRFRSENTLDRF